LYEGSAQKYVDRAVIIDMTETEAFTEKRDTARFTIAGLNLFGQKEVTILNNADYRVKLMLSDGREGWYYVLPEDYERFKKHQVVIFNQRFFENDFNNVEIKYENND
jgi:hypothetical protein